jgi:hypothetical protein
MKNTTPASKPVLYHGRNIAHEFWQSSDLKYLLMRVHEESSWSAAIKNRFQFFAETLDEAARMLGVELNRTLAWEEKDGKFSLVPRPVAPGGRPQAA